MSTVKSTATKAHASRAMNSKCEKDFVTLTSMATASGSGSSSESGPCFDLNSIFQDSMHKRITDAGRDDSDSNDPHSASHVSLPEDKPAPPALWITMEFANAGNLLTEMSRYSDNCIPQSGVLYYSKQVLDGLRYMHRRRITHGDLHLKNILLKYFPIYLTKSCLISEFGSCQLPPHGADDNATDVSDFQERNAYMLCCGKGYQETIRDWSLRKLDQSGAAVELLHIAKDEKLCPRTVDELLELTWPNLIPVPDGRMV